MKIKKKKSYSLYSNIGEYIPNNISNIGEYVQISTFIN
jgi:hypothetical protein